MDEDWFEWNVLLNVYDCNGCWLMTELLLCELCMSWYYIFIIIWLWYDNINVWNVIDW